MKKKYLLHPGEVWVQPEDPFDDEYYLYINYEQLIDLYGLDPKDCEEDFGQYYKVHSGEELKDFIKLYPLKNGNYKEVLKEKKLESNSNI
ncbi:MAG TPA: hypothetical protein PKA90_13490 [Ignavibacteria bacterium]|nr:hypothetical protein [Ignavibacteria bacterium]HMR41433.1 hypothetical protein [Ignavibacteria bacterium]